MRTVCLAQCDEKMSTLNLNNVWRSPLALVLLYREHRKGINFKTYNYFILVLLHLLSKLFLGYLPEREIFIVYFVFARVKSDACLDIEGRPWRGELAFEQKILSLKENAVQIFLNKFIIFFSILLPDRLFLLIQWTKTFHR